MSGPLPITDASTSSQVKPQTSTPVFKNQFVFTSSAATFEPKPYNPHSSHSVNHSKVAPMPKAPHQPVASSSTLRQPITEDARPANAIVIYHPWTNFPNSKAYKGQLTYALLAANPNWYLDEDDFKKLPGAERSGNHLFPSTLEPARGWNKKGEDGFTIMEKGEYKKFRCVFAFCDKNYGGVNAKSMWRRHVLEKHKIPMPNKRDGAAEAGRGGRLSNKENKAVLPAPLSLAPISYVVQDSSNPMGASTGLLPAADVTSERRPLKRTPRGSLKELRPSADTPADTPAASPEQEENEDLVPPSQSPEPEFTVDDDTRASSACLSPRFRSMLPPSSPIPADPGNPQLPGCDDLPPPYDDSRAPAWRKQTERMPWKFPSPSHPLYSSPEDLFLAVPIQGMTGEGLESKYVAVPASPFLGASPARTTQFSSPLANGSPLSSKFAIGTVAGWKRTRAHSKGKSKLPHLSNPSPRGFEIPDLGFSTESEDADTSLSTIDDPFSAWLVSSPGRFPDTPIRRSTSGSTSGSFLEKLRRASPEKPSASASSSSRLLPEGLGLGFNFSIPLTSSGRKRQRSETSLDIGIDDEDFEELEYPRLTASMGQRQMAKSSQAAGTIPTPPHEYDGVKGGPPIDVDAFGSPLRKKRKVHA